MVGAALVFRDWIREWRGTNPSFGFGLAASLALKPRLVSALYSSCSNVVKEVRSCVLAMPAHVISLLAL
jgi:hypothetical protein